MDHYTRDIVVMFALQFCAIAVFLALMGGLYYWGILP